MFSKLDTVRVSAYISGIKLDAHTAITAPAETVLAEVDEGRACSLDVSTLMEDAAMRSSRMIKKDGRLSWNGTDAIVSVYKGARTGKIDVGRRWHPRHGKVKFDVVDRNTFGGSTVTIVPAIAGMATRSQDLASVAAWTALNTCMGQPTLAGAPDLDLMGQIYTLNGSTTNSVRFIHRLAAIWLHLSWLEHSQDSLELRFKPAVQFHNTIQSIKEAIESAQTGTQFVPWWNSNTTDNATIFEVLLAASSGKLSSQSGHKSRFLDMWPVLGQEIVLVVNDVATRVKLATLAVVKLSARDVWYAATRWISQYSSMALWDEAIQFVGTMGISPERFNPLMPGGDVCYALPASNMGALCLGRYIQPIEDGALSLMPAHPGFSDYVERHYLMALVMGLMCWHSAWKVLGWFHTYKLCNDTHAAEYWRRYAPTRQGVPVWKNIQAKINTIIPGCVGRIFSTVTYTDQFAFKKLAAIQPRVLQFEELISRSKKVFDDSAIYGYMYPLLPVKSTFPRDRWVRVGESPILNNINRAWYRISTCGELKILVSGTMASSVCDIALPLNYRGAQCDYALQSGIDKLGYNFEPIFKVTNRDSYYELVDEDSPVYHTTWYVEDSDRMPIDTGDLVRENQLPPYSYTMTTNPPPGNIFPGERNSERPPLPPHSSGTDGAGHRSSGTMRGGIAPSPHHAGASAPPIASGEDDISIVTMDDEDESQGENKFSDTPVSKPIVEDVGDNDTLSEETDLKSNSSSKSESKEEHFLEEEGKSADDSTVSSDDVNEEFDGHKFLLEMSKDISTTSSLRSFSQKYARLIRNNVPITFLRPVSTIVCSPDVPNNQERLIADLRASDIYDVLFNIAQESRPGFLDLALDVLATCAASAQTPVLFKGVAQKYMAVAAMQNTMDATCALTREEYRAQYPSMLKTHGYSPDLMDPKTKQLTSAVEVGRLPDNDTIKRMITEGWSLHDVIHKEGTLPRMRQDGAKPATPNLAHIQRFESRLKSSNWQSTFISREAILKELLRDEFAMADATATIKTVGEVTGRGTYANSVLKGLAAGGGTSFLNQGLAKGESTAAEDVTVGKGDMPLSSNQQSTTKLDTTLEEKSASSVGTQMPSSTKGRSLNEKVPEGEVLRNSMLQDAGTIDPERYRDLIAGATIPATRAETMWVEMFEWAREWRQNLQKKDCTQVEAYTKYAATQQLSRPTMPKVSGGNFLHWTPGAFSTLYSKLASQRQLWNQRKLNTTDPGQAAAIRQETVAADSGIKEMLREHQSMVEYSKKLAAETKHAASQAKKKERNAQNRAFQMEQGSKEWPRGAVHESLPQATPPIAIGEMVGGQTQTLGKSEKNVGLGTTHAPTSAEEKLSPTAKSREDVAGAPSSMSIPHTSQSLQGDVHARTRVSLEDNMLDPVGISFVDPQAGSSGSTI